MIKSIFKIIIPIIILICSWGCETNITMPANESPDYNVKMKKEVLLQGERTEILIEGLCGNSLPQDVQFLFDSGIIEKNGNRYYFTAPNSPGINTIECNLTSENGETISKSLEAMVVKQYIILKADDMIFDSEEIVPSGWRRFIDFVSSKKIKASIGIIGKSLEQGNSAYFQYLRESSETGLIEYWNHGYSHMLNGNNDNGQRIHEFFNTTFEEQKLSILKTQNYFFRKVGSQLTCFGAPGNAIDETTLLALNDFSEIKVWFFGKEYGSQLNLERVCEIEFPTHYPDYQKFVENYNEEKDYLVLQIHPLRWDDERFTEFEQIIDFLIGKGVTFINPKDFYSNNQGELKIADVVYTF